MEQTSSTNARSRWKKAALSGFLSLVFPGMGQLYNRQPRKAVLLFVATQLLAIFVANTRVLLSFPTMVVTVLAGGLWVLFVAGEAVYGAAAATEPESSVPAPHITYSILAVLIFAAVFNPLNDLKSRSGFATFKVPSASMCPTICLGDRFVADMHAYRNKPVQKGDVILMAHPSSKALFIKRVIGVAGDRVEQGKDNPVLVNGQPSKAPAACGLFGAPPYDPGLYSSFDATIVPDGALFVIGDNVGNSFDSRIPEFGSVTPDMVKGRPVFIYWSGDRSRIGCSLR